jgi:hypothetical protein
MTAPDEAFVDDWMRARGIEQFSYSDNASDELIFDWIREQGPEAWHVYATGFSWDSGTDTARWIVDQPGCDKGTALYLYYAATPAYYARYPSLEAARADHADEDARELMLAIAAHWARGQYTDYRFSPGWVFGDTMPDSEAARLALALARDVPWEVPEDLARTGAEGTELQQDHVDGAPAALHAAIMARYEPWEDYREASGTEDVFDVARRLGETEIPSDDTPIGVRMMWTNYILALNVFGSDSEAMRAMPRPDLGGTGIPSGA